jgi:hypothetical protein
MFLLIPFSVTVLSILQLLQTCPENRGTGSSYAWSRGLGFETSPIKTRSVRRKATLSHVLSDAATTTRSDTGALRGLKALAREKYDPSHT